MNHGAREDGHKGARNDAKWGTRRLRDTLAFFRASGAPRSPVYTCRMAFLGFFCAL